MRDARTKNPEWSVRFQYPPSFEFRKVEGAVNCGIETARTLEELESFE